MGTIRETLPLQILIVEDDRNIAATTAEILASDGHQVSVERDGRAALRRIDESVVDLLICDVRLPGADGFAILDRVKQVRPATAVVLMSAYGSIAEAVEAVKGDAVHYLAKPFGKADLLAVVRDVAAARRFRLMSPAPQSGPEAAIIGESPSIVALREFVRTVADSNGPVLITGETGTGKELVASTIHELSSRRDRPFVAVNCAAFTETLLEAELFGHERGAFTGAFQARPGKFRAADGGTLFLDEVGEISHTAQAKLLRVLESGALQPIGCDADRSVDVRVLSATNRDLRGAAGERFRDDLFYRLKMFHVHVPPLRERMSDVPLLVAHLLRDLADGEPPPITVSARAALTRYSYPGNVRELRNAIGHALVVAGGQEIDVCHLPEELRGVQDGGERPAAIRSLHEAEREFERDYLLRTLDATRWNRTRAAELLGISRKTLWKKLRDLGISEPG